MKLSGVRPLAGFQRRVLSETEDVSTSAQTRLLAHGVPVPQNTSWPVTRNPAYVSIYNYTEPSFFKRSVPNENDFNRTTRAILFSSSQMLCIE